MMLNIIPDVQQYSWLKLLFPFNKKKVVTEKQLSGKPQDTDINHDQSYCNISF